MSVDVEQLSCQELVELVTDYLEGALSRRGAARASRSTSARCAGCAAYLEQMRTTIRLPREPRRWGALPPAAERELLERLPRLALVYRERAAGTVTRLDRAAFRRERAAGRSGSRRR